MVPCGEATRHPEGRTNTSTGRPVAVKDDVLCHLLSICCQIFQDLLPVVKKLAYIHCILWVGELNLLGYGLSRLGNLFSECIPSICTENTCDHFPHAFRSVEQLDIHYLNSSLFQSSPRFSHSSLNRGMWGGYPVICNEANTELSFPAQSNEQGFLIDLFI